MIDGCSLKLGEPGVYLAAHQGRHPSLRLNNVETQEHTKPMRSKHEGSGFSSVAT